VPDDQNDPRVLYAADRTVLAAERTYAAWVRTGLVSLVAGVGAKTSLGSVLPEWAILFNATLLVLFSGFCFAVAVWRDLRPGHDSPVRSDVWRLPKALMLVVNGGLLLVSLGALLGVWFGRTGGT
jgi:inner membrane protein YidH